MKYIRTWLKQSLSWTPLELQYRNKKKKMISYQLLYKKTRHIEFESNNISFIRKSRDTCLLCQWRDWIGQWPVWGTFQHHSLWLLLQLRHLLVVWFFSEYKLHRKQADNPAKFPRGKEEKLRVLLMQHKIKHLF